MTQEEHQWIEHLQARWPAVDLRHDTFYDAQSRQIFTTDMLVEGVHFAWTYTSETDLGWKALAVNLSDIAATGGFPKWALVSVGLPDVKPLPKLRAIMEGVESCAKAYRCTIVGGDTVHASDTTISVTVIGYLPQDCYPGRRHQAEPGDVLAISGPHGLSHAGLVALQHDLEGYETVKQAHLRPTPQLTMGNRIAKVLPRFAMMDSSDGLADAALHLAQASGVDIHLDAARLTPPPEVAEIADSLGTDPLNWVLYGGEDFHLVVSIPPETLGLFPELKAIGRVYPAATPGKGKAFLKDDHGLQPLDWEKAFQHFDPRPEPPVSISAEDA